MIYASRGRPAGGPIYQGHAVNAFPGHSGPSLFPNILGVGNGSAPPYGGQNVGNAPPDAGQNGNIGNVGKGGGKKKKKLPNPPNKQNPNQPNIQATPTPTPTPPGKLKLKSP